LTIKRIQRNKGGNKAIQEDEGKQGWLPNGSGHWTGFVEQTDVQKARLVRCAYWPNMQAKDDPVLAAKSLAEAYKDLSEKNFATAVFGLPGLLNMVRHNPNLSPEVEALRMIVSGVTVMNQLCVKAENA